MFVESIVSYYSRTTLLAVGQQAICRTVELVFCIIGHLPLQEQEPIGNLSFDL